MLIKVREGNAEQPLALAVDDDGLIAMVDTQKQVLTFDQHPILINFLESENITRIRKACDGPLQVLEQFKDSHFSQVVDAKGCAVTPGGETLHD